MVALMVEVAGWLAAALILTSYTLVSSNRLSGQSRAYQWMNVVGSALFIINTGWHGALPPLALNVVWCTIGLYTLWRIGSRAAA